MVSMKRIGLYTLAVVCMIVGWIVIGKFTWQAGAGAFLYLCAGYAVYEAVDDAKWSKVRVPKQSMRRLSSSLYNMTPEQQYRAQEIDEAAKRHEAMINNLPVRGKTINLIAEDEWLGREEEEDPYLEQHTIAWLKDRFPAPEDRDGA